MIRLTVIILLFLAMPVISFAQINLYSIYGNWVKSKIEFKDGSEVPDGMELKFHYLRYSIQKPDKLYMSFGFGDMGAKFFFSITNNVLEVNNSYGHYVNSFLIEKLSPSELVLLQIGQENFEEPDCIRYNFIIEEIYQRSLPLTSRDILSISERDTVFRGSEKVHAKFKGDEAFHSFLTSSIPEYSNVVASNNYFLATFIVRKNGKVDSLQIIEGINKNFEKQFIKAFNKVKNNWEPAVLNGQTVDVLMSEEYKFISSGKFIPQYLYSEKAKNSMAAKEYSKALHYFDLSLKRDPDAELLCQRALCKIYLGNNLAACEDLQNAKNLGSLMADSLVDKYCK